MSHWLCSNTESVQWLLRYRRNSAGDKGQTTPKHDKTQKAQAMWINIRNYKMRKGYTSYRQSRNHSCEFSSIHTYASLNCIYICSWKGLSHIQSQAIVHTCVYDKQRFLYQQQVDFVHETIPSCVRLILVFKRLYHNNKSISNIVWYYDTYKCMYTIRVVLYFGIHLTWVHVIHSLQVISLGTANITATKRRPTKTYVYFMWHTVAVSTYIRTIITGVGWNLGYSYAL